MANKRTKLLRLMMVFDLIVVSLAFGIATWSFYQFSGVATVIGFDNFLSIRIKIGNLLLMAAFLYCWHIIFAALGFYRSHRLTSDIAITREVVVATSLGTVVLVMISIGFKISLVNLPFLAIFWLTSTMVLITSRLALQVILQRIRLAGRNLRHVAVVGTNDRARAYAEMIQSRPELGYCFIGYIDDSPDLSAADASLQTVADYDDFGKFTRENVVDEVVVFSPLRSHYDKIAAIVETSEQQGILLRFGADPFSLKIGRSVVDQIDDVAIPTVQTGNMYGHPSMGTKTALDFLISGTLLILLAPLLLVVSVLIIWESPGPVLFVQQRMGINKRRFNIYKFRTMRADAEQLQADLEQQNEADGPVFKIEDDPRITSLGKWLRKTSIDELPQLFNVLKGDMSLVGPRPLPLRDFEGFEHDIHRRRFSVKPGITCLWQISGRSHISFDRWMELDMNYIDHWSLWLDLKILLKTIPAVFTRSGAK